MNRRTKRSDAGGHRTVDNPRMSRATIGGSVEARSARRADRGRPAATISGDLKAFAGWPVLSQMFEAVGSSATGPWL
jgi:hypothetical protein